MPSISRWRRLSRKVGGGGGKSAAAARGAARGRGRGGGRGQAASKGAQGIQFLGNTTREHGTTGGTTTIAYPSDIQAGDLLVLACADDRINTNDDAVGTISGWTKSGPAGNTNSDTHVCFFHKIAAGTETGSLTIPANPGGGTSTERAFWLLHFRGFTPNGSRTGAGFADVSTTNAPMAAATALGQGVAVGAVAFDGAEPTNFTLNDPGGWNALEFLSFVGGASGPEAGLSARCCYKIVEAAGSTGQPSFTRVGGTDDGYSSLQVVIDES